MPSSFPSVDAARWLLQQNLSGCLSTHSQKCPSYPYGSLLPFILDAQSRPVALVSELAQHTRNLKGDAHCALSVTSPSARSDSPRLCLLAQAQFLSPAQSAELTGRYARYFPQAPDPRLFRDFHFLRLQPVKLHLIAGLGEIHWLEGSEILSATGSPPWSAQQEQAFVEDLNTQEADFLQACWLQLTDQSPRNRVALIGVDAEGGDLRCDDQRQRFYFQHRVQNFQQAYEHLKRAALQPPPGRAEGK